MPKGRCQISLIKIFPKRGIFVTNITVNDVSSIYGIRELLEVYAIELAAPNLTPDLLEPYYLLYKEAKDHPTEYYTENTDREFHCLIYEHTNNRYLCDILKRLYDQNTRIRMLSHLRVNNRKRNTCKEHFEIVDALLQGDTKRAKQMMKHHVVTGRKVAMTVTG